MDGDHIVLDLAKRRIVCTRCNQWEPVDLPMPIGRLHMLCGWWLREHGDCGSIKCPSNARQMEAL